MIPSTTKYANTGSNFYELTSTTKYDHTGLDFYILQSLTKYAHTGSDFYILQSTTKYERTGSDLFVPPSSSDMCVHARSTGYIPPVYLGTAKVREKVRESLCGPP